MHLGFEWLGTLRFFLGQRSPDRVPEALSELGVFGSNHDTSRLVLLNLFDWAYVTSNVTQSQTRGLPKVASTPVEDIDTELGWG